MIECPIVEKPCPLKLRVHKTRKGVYYTTLPEQHIAKAYADGMSIDELKKIYDVNRSSLYRILKRENVPIRNTPSKPRNNQKRVEKRAVKSTRQPDMSMQAAGAVGWEKERPPLGVDEKWLDKDGSLSSMTLARALHASMLYAMYGEGEPDFDALPSEQRTLYWRQAYDLKRILGLDVKKQGELHGNP